MTSLKDQELPETLPLDRARSEQAAPGRAQFRPSVQAPTVEGTAELGPLPRRIEGGFLGVASDLERRGRDTGVMLRLLEQNRLILETAEGERDRLYEKLNRLLPEVQASAEELDKAVATSKSGDLSGELSSSFSANMQALDELENVSTALTSNFLAYRSAWEQYARSIIRAQRMREEA